MSFPTLESCMSIDPSAADERLADYVCYCCWFAHGAYGHFMFDELFAVLDTMGLALTGCIQVDSRDVSTPYCFVYLPNDRTASDVCRQCFTMKKIMRHWCTLDGLDTWIQGMTSSDQNIQQWSDRSRNLSIDCIQKIVFGLFSDPVTQKFKIECHRFGRKFNVTEFESLVEQLVKSLKVAYRNVSGDSTDVESIPFVVDLVSPGAVVCFWEMVGLGADGSSLPLSSPVLWVHVGLLVYDNTRGASKLVDTFHLRKGRPYLGPTSLDCQLSFIMSNLGNCCQGKLVLDPFVGTASLLVSAARMGATTLGADIDSRVLAGRGGVTIADNFTAYGLQKPVGLVRCSQDRRVWRTGPIFDAILTDPPYGVRAGARKTPSQEHRGTRSRAGGTVPYSTVQCLDDLLDLAAESLLLGGKLVFLAPHTADRFDDDMEYFEHPCLQLVSSTLDGLNDTRKRSKSVLRRHLIVMRKIAEWQGESMKEALKLARNERNSRHDGDVRSVRDIGAKVFKDNSRAVEL